MRPFKSTLILCLDRNGPGALRGLVSYHGQDLYAPEVDSVEVRKRVGVVFQKPSPFPKSLLRHHPVGPRVLGVKGDAGKVG